MMEGQNEKYVMYRISVERRALTYTYLVLIPAIARRASTDYSLYNGRILNEYLNT